MTMKKRLIIGLAYAAVLFCIYLVISSIMIKKLPGDKKIAREKRNIYFLETTSFGSDGFMMKPRQACAIESAARMNPNTTINLFIFDKKELTSDSRNKLKILLSYENIVIEQKNIDEYVKNSPIEEWWTSGVWKKSHWPQSHMSDVIRYLTLWKFGGIYLDTDFVVKSSLENLSNFACAEDSTFINSAVLGLKKNGWGGIMADAFIKELITNFRGDVWNHNGPGVITRTLKKICATEIIEEMTNEKCHGFTVFPPSAFYPITWQNWKEYFIADEKNRTMNKIENSLAVHMWNKLSHAEPVLVGSKIPYAIIASEYCPKTYNNSGKVF